VKNLDFMAINKSRNQKKFVVNVASNFIAFLVNLAIGFWFTPYLIDNLGVESFGLYPLADSVVSYMSLITLALNGALGRYLALDIHNQSIENAKKTFSSAFFGSIGISILLIPGIILFVNLVPNIINIPVGKEISTQYLFLFLMLAFLVATIDSNFSSISWIKGRFDLRNLVVILSNLCRVLFVILLFNLFSPNMGALGLGILFSSFLSLGGNLIIWKKLAPQIHISIKDFKLRKINELFDMSFWLVIDQIGALLFNNTSLIIANVFIGAKVGGEYGTLIIFSTLINRLISTISSVFSPIIYEKYALNDQKSIIKLSKQSIRILGLMTALPVGLICGLGKPLLEIWLGKDFGSLWLLLVLTLFYLPYNYAITPLFAIKKAMNKVRIPGIVTLILGVVNLLLAIIFMNIFNLGVYGIAIAAAIALTIKNAIFTPLYSAHIQQIPWYTYIKTIIPSMIFYLIVALITWGISQSMLINNWLRLLLSGGLAGLVSLLIFYLLFLYKEEKKYIVSLITNREV